MSRRAPSGLDRSSLGTAGMWFFTVSASAPMTVLAGSVVATFAVTGVVGVPLSFVLLALALYPFTVAYTAMSRRVPHAGVFYSYVALGLGRTWGIAGGLVALLSYNAIQICLYGLLGASLTTLWPGVHLPWWGWAIIAWAIVGGLGVLRNHINARVLTTLLVCEIGMILLFDIGAFTHPAGGHLSLSGLAPGRLFVGGIGGALAFGIAAFVGFEVAPVYGEEAKGRPPVARATFAALGFLGVLYALSSLALSVTVGPEQVVTAAQDLNSGIPFSTISSLYGGVIADFAHFLLITSIFAALVSFHNSAARYVFAMARERVLPSWLGVVGSRSGAGAPIGGSLLQSAVAIVVFGAFAVSGADPVTTLFTWLSYIAAVGVLALMVATSVAAVRYFRGVPAPLEPHETTWVRVTAPVLGAVALAVVLSVTVYNSSAVLGTNSSSPLTVVLPGIVALFAAIGLLWGAILQRARPEIYQRIGAGQTKPLAVLSHAFAGEEI
jgi:amino acid transporter